MRRLRRVTLRIALFFAILFAIVLVPLSTRRGQQLAVRAGLAYAGRQLGLPVRAAGVEPALFSRRLALSDLRIGEFARVERVEISWSWRGLLAGPHLSSALASGVHVNLAAPHPVSRGGGVSGFAIDRLAAERLSFSGLPADIGELVVDRYEGGFAGGLPRGALDGSLNLRARENFRSLSPIALRARLGEGRRAPWTLALTSPEVELAGAGELRDNPWLIEGHLQGRLPMQTLTDKATGTLQIDATVKLDPDTTAVRWSLESPMLRGYGRQARAVAAAGTVDGGRWELTSARALLPGGLVEMTAAGSAEPLAAHAELRSSGFELTELLASAPAGASARFSGKLLADATRDGMTLTGEAALTLAYRQRLLLSGPLTLVTRDATPVVRVDLHGSAGSLKIEPAGGRYTVRGELQGAAFELTRALAQGRWPLNFELTRASFTGEIDPHAPRFNGNLSGDGTMGGQNASIETTLLVNSREWRAEPLTLKLGAGGFAGRAGGPLGAVWPALAVRPLAFARPVPRLVPAPAAYRPEFSPRLRLIRPIQRGAEAGGNFSFMRTASRPASSRAAANAVPQLLPPAGMLVEGDFDRLPLAPLVPEDLHDWGIGGTLSGRIRLHGQELLAALKLENGAVRALKLPALEVSASGRDGRWDFRAADREGRYELAGTGPRGFTLRGHLPVDPSLFLPEGAVDSAAAAQQLSGELELQVVSEPAGGLRLSAQYEVAELRAGKESFGPLSVALNGDPRRPALRLRLPARGLDAEGTIDLARRDWRAIAQLEQFVQPVTVMSKALNAPLTGTLAASGDFARSEAINGGGWLAGVHVDWGRTTVEVAPLSALPDPAAEGVALDFRLNAHGPLGAGTGRLRIEPARGVALTLTTRGSAAFISAMIDELHLEGEGNGDLRLRFPWKGDSEMHGEWDAAHAGFGWRGLPIALSEAFGHVRLTGSSLYLEDMIYGTEGGRGGGQARLDFGEHGMDHVAIETHARTTRMNFVPGLNATADADLAITYHWDSGWVIGGSAEILGGRYQPQSGSGQSAETAGNAEPGKTVALDLEIRSQGGLDLISNLYRAAVTGALHLSGPSDAPFAAGRLEALPGGLLRFRDRQYAVNHLILDFSGGEVSDGAIDLEGETAVRGYRIFLDGAGTLRDLRVNFRADPALDQQNIVTLLLTGKTQDELSAQGIQPSNEIFALYLADQAINLTDQAGVTGEGRFFEYVALTPALDASRGFTAPAITVGKSVTDRLSTLWRFDLGSSRYSAEGEYAFTRSLRFGVTTGSLYGGVGGDFRYFTPFDFDKGLRVSRPTEPALRVAGVEIIGLSAGDPGAARLRKKIKPGAKLTRARLLAAIDRLRADLRGRGNLLARISYSETQVANGVQLVLTVAKGRAIALSVFDGTSRRRDLEKRLRKLDFDVPFLSELRLRLQEELQTALAEAGRLDRVIRETMADEQPADGAVQGAGDAAAGSPGRNDLLLLRYDFAPAPAYRVRRLARHDWPAAPPGAPSPRDYFPSLRFGLRFTPWPHWHAAMNETLLADGTANYRAALAASGYFAAKLESRVTPEGRFARVSFTLDPGPRAIARSVEFSGGEPPVAAASLPIRAGEPVSSEALKESVRRMQDAWMRAGYRHAKAAWTTKISDDGATAVTFALDAGAAETTGPITLIGLRHTRASAVHSRLAIQSDKPLDPRDIDASRTALYRSGVFTSVDIKSPSPAAGEVTPVAVAVRERPRFEFGGALGYDSEEKLREGGQLGYNNLFGTARRLSLSLKHSTLEQRADLTYRDPSIFGFNIEFTLAGRYQFQRTDSFDLWRRGVDARATLPLSRRLSLQGIAQLTRLTLGEIHLTLTPAQQQIFDRQRSVPSLGAALVYNGRDEAINPRRGDLVSFGAQYAAPLFSGTTVRFTKWTFTAFHYQPLATLVWAQGLRFGWIRTPLAFENFPLSERFYAGGDGTVRGFRRDLLGPADRLTGNPLGGLSQLIFNEELRFPVGAQRKTFLSLFVDAGNVSVGGPTYKGLRPSYGAGFFFLSPIGPLRLEYGRPFSPLPGEPQGVFHFAIGRAF